MTGRIQGIKERYEDIQESNMFGCIQDILDEAASTGSIAKLTEEDYANVSNYQARQVHNSFTDPNYQIEKYNHCNQLNFFLNFPL